MPYVPIFFFLSLFIIIFIWNYFKRIKHYSMEKVTRGLLEYFHECLICKNYIRSRKRKVSQEESHAQQVQSRLDSKLLIPSASHETHCTVPQRSVLADLGPQWGMALSNGSDGQCLSSLLPWGSHPPACAANIPSSRAIKGMESFWMIPSYPNYSGAHLFPHCFL